MAETIQYGITLNSGQAVSSAEAAAQAMDELHSSIKADQRAMAEAQKSLKLLGKETQANAMYFKNLKATIEAKRAAISDAALDVQKLGGTFRAQSRPANDFRSGLQELGKDAKDLGGPIGQLFGRMEQLSKFAGSSKAKFVLAGVGIAAIGAAATTAALKMFNFSQELAATRDKELKDLGGFLSVQDGVKNFAQDAMALQDIIGRISHNSAASREEVSGVAKELIKAGVSGRQLERSLEAANMASVVAGQEGVQQFIAQAKAARDHGKTIATVAAAFRTKYGPAARKALLTNEAIAKRFSDNMAGLFDKIDFTPLQAAKKRFVDLFDTNSLIGRSLASTLRPMLEGIRNFFTRAIDFAADFVVDWVIGFKRIEIAYYDLKLTLKDFSHSLFGLGAAIAAWVERSGGRLTGWLTDLKSAWQQFDARQLGVDIINGILKGLTAGWDALKKGVTELAVGVQDQFKQVLGIHSPSLVFKELGMQLPRGLEQGIQAEQPRAQRAVENLISVPSAAAPSRAVSITVEAPITINSQGNLQQDAASLQTQLTAVLAGVAQQLGARLA